MARPGNNPASDPGPKAEPPPIGMGRIGRIALIGTVLWVAAIGGALLWSRQEAASLRLALTLLAALLPVAMFWGGLALWMLHRENRGLHTAIDALYRAWLEAPDDRGPVVARQTEEIAAAQKTSESAPALFPTMDQHPAKDDNPEPPVPDRNEAAGAQGLLPLSETADSTAPPVSMADFIRALNFPDDAEDREGFRVLRRVLCDRHVAQLVQASQDVLTLLAQDGIFMEDLRPDHADPGVWRRFAEGKRGPVIAALGGIRDRSCLASITARMRRDAVFRDSAHHFLRRFDTVFAVFVTLASDEDLSALADTRTARAFMLVGRVAGTFD